MCHIRLRFLGLALGIALGWPAVATAQTWTDKVTTTPVLIQDGMGPVGTGLANNGLAYCVPTAAAMSFEYLGINGFTQLSPAAPTAADGLNLTRILGGLMSTDSSGGTTGAGQNAGFLDYLAAKGISTANYSYGYVPLSSSDAVSALAAVNTNQTVVNLTFGEYSTGASPTRIGGHEVTLLAQGVDSNGQSSPNTIVINNPQPSVFAPTMDATASGRQYLNLVPSAPEQAQFGGTRLDPNDPSGLWPHAQTVLEGYNYLTINASQLAANNPTPATWTLSGNKPLNTNGGDLTVLAPLAGAGGITKSGDGTLTLTAASTTTGGFFVSGGTLASTVAAGQPFGSGPLRVSAGTLALTPAGGGGGAVNLTAASSSAATFTYGTAELQLDRGGYSSLTFTVGGYTDGTTPNLVQSPRGTLVLSPAGGTAGLGSTERFVVNGTGGNLPAVTNGIVSPSIVARDSGANETGDFLTYGANGFARASYTQASVVPINSATPSTVYEANVNQTLTPGSTASMYALKVGAATANGAAALQVGPQTAGTQAGLILNGGTIATSTLAFGQSDAMVYAGPVGGTVSAAIQGSGSMVKFGTGALTVTAPSQFTGTTYVQQGTFVAANASGSATGSGAVVVGPAGTLQINTGATAGSAAGTTAQAGGTVQLNGGTLSGPLVMSAGSNLTGSGTVSGSATLSGTISGLTNLTFTGPVQSTSGTMTYSWRLNALDANPANAGVSFSQLHFANGTQTNLGTGPSSGFRINLDLAAGLPDPNGNDPFWHQSHTWAVMTASPWFEYIWCREAGFPTFADGSFSIAFEPGYTAMDIVYTPVPEPSWLVGAAFLGLAAWGGMTRRRRARAGAAVAA